MTQTHCGACLESLPVAVPADGSDLPTMSLSNGPEVPEVEDLTSWGAMSEMPEENPFGFFDKVPQDDEQIKSPLPLSDMVQENDGTSKSKLNLPETRPWQSKRRASGQAEQAEHADKSKAMANKTTLSLSDLVEIGAEKARIKLKSTAQPFKSVREPTADAKHVIAQAVEVVSSCADVFDVQVRDGGMGGTTVIIAKSLSAEPDPSLIFSLVKDTLLNAASQSENTYIMGYGAQPFQNLDTLSFSASIACPPVALHKTTCWDTYEKGYCPRCATCCWNHPAEIDKMRVIVMIQNNFDAIGAAM